MEFCFEAWEYDTIYKMDKAFRRGYSEQIKSVRDAQDAKSKRKGR